VTDITYLSTLVGWVYVAVVLDLFSRKVVGWAIGDSLATPLVAAALRRAIETRQPLSRLSRSIQNISGIRREGSASVSF